MDFLYNNFILYSAISQNFRGNWGLSFYDRILQDSDQTLRNSVSILPLSFKLTHDRILSLLARSVSFRRTIAAFPSPVTIKGNKIQNILIVLRILVTGLFVLSMQLCSSSMTDPDRVNDQISL
jgi:hypothetical protein